MNISIIIPNYNGEAILKKNLSKVLDAVTNYSEGKIEIIVVDDASSDNSVKIIDDFIKKNNNSSININLIKNSENKGFSTNVNIGVKKAVGEIVVLLNTDVAPHINFLKPLISHFEDDSVFGVGCKDESIEGGKVVPRGRGVGKWKKGFLIHSAGELDKKTTLWASGGSSAFRKSIWDKLGGMDELYNPFYWEDIDLSYRALKSGYRVVFEKDSIVRHEHEKGAIMANYSNKQIKVIAYRNQFIFTWKNSDLSTLTKHILWLPYYLLKAIIRLEFSFYQAFFKGLAVLPKVVRNRIEANKNFVKSDKDIINSI